LRIADEAGRLIRGNWGIKERFISAAFLRGICLENAPLDRTDNPTEIDVRLGSKDFEGPRLLDIQSVNGNLAWIFYLLKPKDIMVVRDDSCDLQLGPYKQDSVTVWNLALWNDDNLSSPTKIRHRFLVYCAHDRDTLDKDRARLPVRVFIPEEDRATSAKTSSFVPIGIADLAPDCLSPAKLLQRRVEWLLARKKATMPVIVHVALGCDKPKCLLEKSDAPKVFMMTADQLSQWEHDWYQKESRPPIVLLRRHGTDKGWHEDKPVLLYEPHEWHDPIRHVADTIAELDCSQLKLLAWELVEAALSRALILDERLDATSQKPLERGYSCTTKQLFSWKGIDIRGTEFSSQGAIPCADELESWVRDRDFDFLLIHHTILQKVEQSHGQTRERVCDALRQHVPHVIVHSGRVDSGELPAGVRFLPLSHVTNWFSQNAAKKQIIEDLCLLRRV